jgi:hypothetical protein
MNSTKNSNAKAAALVGQALIHSNASALLAKEANGDAKSFAVVAAESEEDRKRRMAPSMAAAFIGSNGVKALTAREVADLSRLSKSTADRFRALGAAMLLFPEAKRTVALVETLWGFTAKTTDGPEGLTQNEVESAAKGLTGDVDAIVAALVSAQEAKAKRFAKAEEAKAAAKAKADEEAAAKAKAEAEADMTREEAALAKALLLADEAKAIVAAIVAANVSEWTSEDWNGLVDAVNTKGAARKAHRAAEAAKANEAAAPADEARAAKAKAAEERAAKAAEAKAAKAAKEAEAIVAKANRAAAAEAKRNEAARKAAEAREAKTA